MRTAKVNGIMEAWGESLKSFAQQCFIGLIGIVLIHTEVRGQAIRVELHEQNERGIDTIQMRFGNMVKAEAGLVEFQRKQRGKGYVAYSIDSVQRDSLRWLVKTYRGAPLKQIRILNGNIDPEVFSNFNAPQRADQLNAYLNQILTFYENHGHPFSEVYIDSVEMKSGIAEASVFANIGKEITIESIRNIHPENRMNQKFMERILHLESNSLYNKKRIDDLKERIDGILYLRMHNAPSINFKDSFCQILLDIGDKKSNRINGLLGILPNSASTNELLITGDVQIQLYHLFNRGIEFGMNWQKLQPFSQKLNLKFDYPYFLNLPFGLSGNFNLQKQDTTFLNLDWGLGFSFSNQLHSTLSFIFQNKSSIVLSSDTNFVFTKQLPTFLDYTAYLFGLQWTLRRTNDLAFPTEGYQIDLKSGVGFKSIEQLASITSRFDQEGRSFKYLYDSIELNPINVQIGLSIDKFTKLSRAFILKSGIQSKIIFSKNITINEQYRIGGNRTLRGFDEESITSPYYVIVSNELRLLFSKQSYLYGFFDIASLQDRRFVKFKQDNPIGFGIGIALSTKGGIFGVSYALGKQFENPIEFRSAKIHFGYVNQF